MCRTASYTARLASPHCRIHHRIDGRTNNTTKRASRKIRPRKQLNLPLRLQLLQFLRHLCSLCSPLGHRLIALRVDVACRCRVSSLLGMLKANANKKSPGQLPAIAALRVNTSGKQIAEARSRRPQPFIRPTTTFSSVPYPSRSIRPPVDMTSLG